MAQLEQPWSMVPCLIPAAGQAIGGAVGLIKMEGKQCYRR